ncbi:hypothetical protein JXB41_02630 [Candidatus Woesearchaeota archaeon]|nr:hypothetical protein [Candidatus Woesearchaeota archaeon]
MKKIIIIMFFLVCAYLAYSYPVPPYYDSIPLIPTEFYGTVTIYDVNNTPLPAGTIIETYAYNASCGVFYVQNTGYYGLLSCLGDDNSTSNTTEGAFQGQNILFRINNESTLTTGDTVWYSGEFHRVDINPEPRCGNDWCEIGESCINCAEDCGLCPQNQTPGPGGPGGGGGGGEEEAGGGGGGGGAGGQGGYVTGGRNISATVCVENWVCTEWMPEVCPIEEIQTRNCSDLNVCHTNYTKPEELRNCTYMGTCFDYLLNQDESDIDCGGLICEHCDLNKKCRVDTDCKSGFCHPFEKICKIPTCDDGIQNQGETGIDCGGPCPPCEGIRPILERPGQIIEFIIRGCGPFPWIFVLISSLVLVVCYLLGKLYIRQYKKTRKFERLDRLQQLQKIYSLERNLHMFLINGILMIVAVSLYLFYFCQIVVWIFILVMGIIPLVVMTFMKYMVYDEKRKEEKLRQLVITHEEQIRRMIEIENQELKRLHEEIKEGLADILKEKGLEKELKQKLDNINKIIQVIDKSARADPEVEQSFVDKIDELETSKELIEKTPQLKKTNESLLFLQKILMDKLKLGQEIQEDRKAEERIEKQAEEGEQKPEEKTGENPEQPKQEEKKPEEQPKHEEKKQEPQEQKGEKKPEQKPEQKPEEPANEQKEDEDEIKQEQEIKKLENKESNVNKVDINKKPSPDKYFKLNNGVVLKDIKELIEELKIMEDSLFYYHVNEFRNDFYNWIKGVFKYNHMAEEIKNAKTKEEMITRIDKYLENNKS